MPSMVFRKRDAAQWFASCENMKWGTLAWPVDMLLSVDCPAAVSFRTTNGAAAQWHHILDVDAYAAVSYTAKRRDVGVVLEFVGVEEPLAKAALRQSKRLSFTDLDRLASHYNLKCGFGRKSRPRLLEILIEHLGGDDEVFKKQALEGATSDDGCKLLADDPMFELTFEELDHDERQELADVKKALDRKKTSAHVAHCHARKRAADAIEAKAKAKAKAAAKAKAKPKAAAKAPPAVPPAVPAAAAKAKPKAAVVLPGRACSSAGHRSRGKLKYVMYGDLGVIGYSAETHMIEATCTRHACTLHRCVPTEIDAIGDRTRGRVIGLMCAWLDEASNAAVDSREIHNVDKKYLCLAGSSGRRRAARELLWGKRVDQPNIHELFAVEATVPDAILGGMQAELWEPMVCW